MTLKDIQLLCVRVNAIVLILNLYKIWNFNHACLCLWCLLSITERMQNLGIINYSINEKEYRYRFHLFDFIQIILPTRFFLFAFCGIFVLDDYHPNCRGTQSSNTLSINICPPIYTLLLEKWKPCLKLGEENWIFFFSSLLKINKNKNKRMVGVKTF